MGLSLRVTARVAVVPLALGLAACSASPGTEPPPGDVPVGQTSSAILASDAIARAEEWVAAKVPYCQSANHEADPDTACAATCTRPDNAQWDPYRSDCSGFVSWAWGLPAPGRTTFELAPAQTDITKVIPAAELQPGDAINIPHDHMMLFKAWITPGQRAVLMEEPGCSSPTPYAHEFDSNVILSGTQITVEETGQTFTAIRFDALQEDADGGAHAPDAAAPKSDAATTPADDDAGSGGGDPGDPYADDAGADAGPRVDRGKGFAYDPNGTGGCSAAPARGDSRGAAAPVALALVALARLRRRKRAA